jgi:hypothetical protein
VGRIQRLLAATRLAVLIHFDFRFLAIPPSPSASRVRAIRRRIASVRDGKSGCPRRHSSMRARKSTWRRSCTGRVSVVMPGGLPFFFAVFAIAVYFLYTMVYCHASIISLLWLGQTGVHHAKHKSQHRVSRK